MKRLLLAGLALLSACAPAATGAGGASSSAIRAAFDTAGVAWVQGGRAYVAFAPAFAPLNVRVPTPAADAGWWRGTPYAALPDAALLISLAGEPRVRPAGRVVRLSNTRAYREDGSAVTYDGSVTTGVVGGPDRVVTSGDGLDYALLGGRLVRVSDGVRLDSVPKPQLVITTREATTANVPTVVTPDGTYRLTGDALERADATGVVRARVPHGPGVVGVSGPYIVTVSEDGRVRAFTADLSPVR
ncbi:hypothetical protein [Deinococcus maricopensis]|uniref:Lipoprotein n=1 Tax=Deinococcus maricopensis (strain DSM 21211 / LMG 22137 / NRRL B-23946 / LB-34) TaxID=709986 RepID=E8U8B3_DEIML|nr:hypothetical protein [Deinococcus maricopensis]ADV67302.1 hypothetical protein Deima_1653 [Deinococcus maricopensis DSM 21211]